MAYFQHNPNNYINISDDILFIQLSLEDFLYFEPSYSLSAPYVSQFYNQGISWSKNTNNTQTMFSIPWANGDLYISKIQDYIDGSPPPISLERAKEIRTNDLINLFSQKNAGNINYTGMTTIFPSNFYNSNALITYQARGILPVGFTIPDVNGNLIVMTLAQLLVLNDGIVDLYYLNELNFNIHAETIQTLTTIEDVMAYNITTGWPSLPYVI